MGSYNFQWQMVQDDGGVGAFGSATPNVAVTNGIDNAAFVAQVAPGLVAQGERKAVSLTFKNTGNTTWRSANGYRLVSQNPALNTTWGLDHVELPADVAPGESVTFAFDIVAPQTRGTYNFQWRMTHEGRAAFGEASANLAILDGLDNAQIAAQEVPASMTPGGRYPVSVTVQNTGNTVWRNAEGYRLASQNPAGNANWGVARIELPADVVPGASVRIAFEAVAPTVVGVYSFRWRMERAGAGFGQAGPDASVRVGAAPGNVYFIEPDHLGTPRLIADETLRSPGRVSRTSSRVLPAGG